MQIPVQLEAVQRGAKLMGVSTAQALTALAGAFVPTYAATTWSGWLPKVPDFWLFVSALAVLLMAGGKGVRALTRNRSYKSEE